MAPLELNPAYIAQVRDILKTTPYFDLIDMELEDLAPGRALFKIPARKKHVNPFDRVHGGVFASIIDAATFWAIFTKIPEENPMTTVELKINYLAPIEAQKTMLAEGTAIKVGRSLGVAEANLTEAETGRLIGFGTATCMILPPPLPDVMANMPRKFL